MSAWVLSPKPKQTTSLLDIMSEELVTKLATAETPTEEVIDESSISHYENIDFELHADEIPIEGEDIDSDLALALALQEIEELEHLHHLQQQEQQQHQNPSDQYSKINISHSPGEHLFPTRNRKGAAHDPLDEDDLDSGDSLITDHRILNNLKSFEQKRHQKGIVSGGRISGKDLKITSETVLDPTTRMILFKLIQNNKIDKLHGVIKTGKEANVYHGYRQPSSGNGGEDQRAKQGGHESLKFNWNEETTDFAVKVFKTTLNEFSNRQDYFHGDHRFHGQKFTKGGTKESIAKWTEKEYRNLTRAYQAKLPVPQPIYFKENVLVMSLVDENSSPTNITASTSTSVSPDTASKAIPSPQLKELNHSSFPSQNWTDFYSQTLSLLDRLYHDCHLVHGDLSEYNLLLHSPTLTVFVIDFGQSVDISHPHHLDFLQRDIQTINQFYQRNGVIILSQETIISNILSGDRSLTLTGTEPQTEA